MKQILNSCKPITNVFLRWAKVFVCLIIVLSLCSYFGKVSQYLELISHLRLQYFILTIAIGAIFLLFSNKRWLIVCFFSLCINGAEIFPWYWDNSTNLKDNDNFSFRILLSNVNTANRQYSKLIDLVNYEAPNIIALIEINREWMDAMESLNARYPYYLASPRSDNFGIAIFSEIPFEKNEVINLGDTGLPSIYIEFKVEEKVISLLATHPLPPTNSFYFPERNQQLDEITEFINAISNSKIVVGDLNVTMWSHYYKKLIDTTGLENTRKGFGIIPTWPTSLPALMMPIDHCLISEDLNTVNMSKSVNIGSDHYPLLINISI